MVAAPAVHTASAASIGAAATHYDISWDKLWYLAHMPIVVPRGIREVLVSKCDRSDTPRNANCHTAQHGQQRQQLTYRALQPNYLEG